MIGKSCQPQPNPRPGGCWGTLSRCYGYCDKPARPGKLTCWCHQNAESRAQRLKERLEAADKGS
jgi:hypothetical protein